MKELIEKTENLKEAISNTEVVKEYKKSKEKVLSNKELMQKIEDYKNTRKEELKKEIENNKDYQEYKHLENECNFIILEINQKLKEINDKGSCGK